MALQAQPREECGKGAGRRIRSQGRIPAVVYGLSQPSRNVSVNQHDLEVLMHRAGEHGMIALTIGEAGAVEHVLLREYQRDPVNDRLVHADFFRIDPDKPVHIDVPIMAVGTPVGVREGGILEQLVRTVEVRCLPRDLPRMFECDVSAIGVGHSLHVSEVAPPAAVEVLTDPGTALFAVVTPRKVEVEEVAAAEEAEVAEPELVEKEKKEEEGKEQSARKE